MNPPVLDLIDEHIPDHFLWILGGDNPARLLYKRLDFITTKRRQKLGTDPERRYWE